MKLYKYRSTSKFSLEGLINNELYFSKYTDFNDPFEFATPFPDLVKTYKKAEEKFVEYYANKEIPKEVYLELINLVKTPSEDVIKKRFDTLSEIKNNTQKMGIFCMSKTDGNILMWSHYAEEHKGFCIEFNELNKHLLDKADLIDVNYLDNFEDLNNPDLIVDFFMLMFWDYRDLPRSEWERKYIELAQNLKMYEEYKLALSIIGNKYVDWSYEKEVRLVTCNNGVIKYDPQSIISITFGLRMSESDKATIRNICKTDDKCHIKFKQAEKLISGYGLKNIYLKTDPERA
ncbi:DUF2971 domain-containing protein [Vibrio sp. S234-5]|uniref:DUF2971 domain-containing protein n=1 Tax=Vibrio sp. S234-5 TaxID=1616781 RepID=UPI0005F0AF75|nr:DUF2971 domain-containing protein [Vibrio sp. S234-5]KJR18275.1 hypothetical protein UF06_22265 [Vibrio sp. S234-5]